jgi:hypothetical protein
MESVGITARWSAPGQSGRMPGHWGSSSDAERAAKAFMAEYPQVTTISLYHATGGFLREVKRS